MEDGERGSSAAAAAAPQPQTLVFFCANCRTIVGDSLSFVGADARTKTLTLSSASSVRVSPR